MDTNAFRLAEAYMTAWQNKDLDGIAEYIHPKVHFKGPMAEFTNREGWQPVYDVAQRLWRHKAGNQCGLTPRVPDWRFALRVRAVGC